MRIAIVVSCALAPLLTADFGFAQSAQQAAAKSEASSELSYQFNDALYASSQEQEPPAAPDPQDLADSQTDEALPDVVSPCPRCCCLCCKCPEPAHPCEEC